MFSELDYPAAHSMDTTWWAVDRHGHVARFDTGGAGAVPDGVRPDDGPRDSDVVEALIEGGAKLQCDDLLAIPSGQMYRREVGERDGTPETEPGAEGYLLQLQDEAILTEPRSLAARGAWYKGRASTRMWRLQADGRVVVWMPSLRKRENYALVQRWLSDGTALRAWSYRRPLELWRLGLFSYAHLPFDSRAAGPYERETLPPAPLVLGALPRRLRALERIAFADADFQLEALLQPCEHLPCQTWDEHWISTTGQWSTRSPPPAGPHTDEPVLPPALALEGLAGLVAAYLAGARGSAEVLGDWLKERGQPPLGPARNRAERLDQVLHCCFDPEPRQQLERTFVAHLLTQESPPREQATVIQAILEAPLPDPALAQQALDAWAPRPGEVRERSRLCWAAWALAAGIPLVPGRTARAMRPSELDWQVERALERLRGLVGAR